MRGVRAFFTISLAVVATLALGAPNTAAYQTYTAAKGNYASNCAHCHGDFKASPYISPKDGQSWGTSLHLKHQSMVSSDCNTCHYQGKNPVLMNRSVGGIGFDPIGCVGCHGREGDRQTPPPGPTGDGAGLRQHHTNAGVTDCVGCHSDADPGNYTPVGEGVLPPFYFTPDTAHTNKPTDPCSPLGEEDYAGSPLGLDNDGDGIFDTDDPDCERICGDGVLDPGEECDDGNTNDGDCCAADCTFEPSGSPCPDDGNACTTDECDGAGSCGTPVACPVCETCDPGVGGCVVALRADCRGSIEPKKAKLAIKDKPVDKADLVLWKWIKGAATLLADFGDPLAVDDYGLCIYDLSGAEPSLVFRAQAPAGGTCATKPCWKATSAGFKYRDKEGTPDGLQTLILKSGEDGKAKAIVKGRGGNLGMPALPLGLPLRVQLHGGNGRCWEAGYFPQGVKKNDTTQFKGTAGSPSGAFVAPPQAAL